MEDDPEAARRQEIKDKLRILLAGDRKVLAQDIEIEQLDDENNLLRHQLFTAYPDLLDDEIRAILKEREQVARTRKAFWLHRILDDYEF